MSVFSVPGEERMRLVFVQSRRGADEVSSVCSVPGEERIR